MRDYPQHHQSLSFINERGYKVCTYLSNTQEGGNYSLCWSTVLNISPAV